MRFTIQEQLILFRALSVYSDFVKYDYDYQVSVKDLLTRIREEAPQVPHNLNVREK